MVATLVVLGFIGIDCHGWMSVAVHDGDVALQIDRVLHNQLLS